MKWILIAGVIILAGCCPVVNCNMLDDSVRCNFDTSTVGKAFKAEDLDTILLAKHGPQVKGIERHTFYYKKGVFTMDTLPLQSGVLTLPLSYTSDTVDLVTSNGKKFTITNYLVETKADRTNGGCQKCPNIGMFELEINGTKFTLLSNTADNGNGVTIAGGYVLFNNK